MVHIFFQMKTLNSQCLKFSFLVFEGLHKIHFMAVLAAEMFTETNHKFHNTKLIFLWIKYHSVSRRFFLRKQYSYIQKTLN